MWFYSQWLMQLPFELQFPPLSPKPCNSHFFLSAAFVYCYAIHIQSKLIWFFFFLAEAAGEVVAESFLCFVFLQEGPRYIDCWITRSVSTILMTLHSCHFMHGFELFKSGAPGWKQREVVVWVFLQIKVTCLLLQLESLHFLMEYLAQGCSAGFGFVKHLLRKSADYQRPRQSIAFKNASLILIQQLWSSVGKRSTCKF